jgi:hypothetical protein
MATRLTRQLVNAHLLSDGCTAVDTIGVKLYSYGVGIEIIEPDLSLKYVLPITSFNLHFAEV